MTIIKKNHGFTLVELAVVLAIMALIVSMTAYLIKLYEPDIRLYTAARELRNQLERAKSLTLTTQAPHGIFFDTNNDSYQLVELSSGTVVLETFNLTALITFDSVGPFTDDIVSFNPAGAASEAGDIALINQNNLAKTIKVKPSGYVLIQ